MRRSCLARCPKCALCRVCLAQAGRKLPCFPLSSTIGACILRISIGIHHIVPIAYMSEHPGRSVSTANASANPDCLDNRKCIPLRPCRRRAYDCWTFMQPNIERAKRLQVSSVAISSARDPWQHATLLLRSERSDFFAMLCLCSLPRTGSIGGKVSSHHCCPFPIRIRTKTSI